MVTYWWSVRRQDSSGRFVTVRSGDAATLELAFEQARLVTLFLGIDECMRVDLGRVVATDSKPLPSKGPGPTVR